MNTQRNYNTIVGTYFLAIGLFSFFLLIFGSFKYNFFGTLIYFVSSEWPDSLFLYERLSLFIWFIFAIISYFLLYKNNPRGKFFSLIGSIVGIFLSQFLYWGGIGAFFLVAFVILLIMNISYWKKIK